MIEEKMQDDLISRQALMKEFSDFVRESNNSDFAQTPTWNDAVSLVGSMPSAQPFHNITMNDVLKYIDSMPEDVWQEFTACLECRGWELQRRTAKWCGGEFV